MHPSRDTEERKDLSLYFFHISIFHCFVVGPCLIEGGDQKEEEEEAKPDFLKVAFNYVGDAETNPPKISNSD